MDFEFKNLTAKESKEKEALIKKTLKIIYKDQRFILLVDDRKESGPFSMAQAEDNSYLMNMILMYITSGWMKAIENGSSRQDAVAEANHIFNMVIKRLTTGE